MNMALSEIEKHLKALRLHGMNSTLSTRITQANQGDCFVGVFACLLQDELDSRHSRLIESRFKASGLRERPTLTEFDWSFNPKLPKKEIYELVSGKFISNGQDALLIGSPGTGKSHIAKTVAHGAIESGYKVMYREAHSFIDDLFLRKKMPDQAADDLLDIILTRYSARRSTVISSNRPLEDWGKLLRDNAASSAIVDRLLHRGHLLQFEGRSYRLKEASIRLAANKRKRSG
jgi:DNA replication protein DnaC